MGHETRQEKLTRSGSDAKQFNSRYRSGRTDEVGKLRDMGSQGSGMDEPLTPFQEMLS